MKKYNIVYLPLAKDDLFEIINYISDYLHSPQAAMKLLNKLEHSILLSEDFPYSHILYNSIKRLKCEYRIFSVDNYAILYTVLEELKTVEIKRIIYAKIDISNLIIDRE